MDKKIKIEKLLNLVLILDKLSIEDKNHGLLAILQEKFKNIPNIKFNFLTNDNSNVLDYIAESINENKIMFVEETGIAMENGNEKTHYKIIVPSVKSTIIITTEQNVLFDDNLYFEKIKKYFELTEENPSQSTFFFLVFLLETELQMKEEDKDTIIDCMTKAGGLTLSNEDEFEKTFHQYDFYIGFLLSLFYAYVPKLIDYEWVKEHSHNFHYVMQGILTENYSNIYYAKLNKAERIMSGEEEDKLIEEKKKESPDNSNEAEKIKEYENEAWYWRMIFKAWDSIERLLKKK